MLTKQNKIDVGISVLCALASPGQTLTYQAIAEVCDCHRNRIMDIEKKALAKLRRRINIYDHLEQL